MKTTFQEVTLYGQKNVKCSGGCGKRLQRQKKFYQTLSPFNKTVDGKVKDSGDIYPELKADILEWKEQPETCVYCRDKGRAS